MKFAKILLPVLLIISLLTGCNGLSGLNGRWEYIGETDRENRAYIFSGNNVTFEMPGTLSDRTGTFSIANDQIEFVFAPTSITARDGQVVALPFTRTENTITIGARQFVRESAVPQRR
jgi:hypothetical protein